MSKADDCTMFISFYNSSTHELIFAYMQQYLDNIKDNDKE